MTTAINQLINNEGNDTIRIKTYRFVFSDSVIEELEYFSQLHQFDDRKAFKEAWKEWFHRDEIQPIMNEEINRLVHTGYKGNIEEKMFKSARYYFRKKPANKPDEKKKRKQYIGLSSEFLKSIDNHIISCLNANMESNAKTNTNNNVTVLDVQPAEAYEDFCTNHREDLQEELRHFAEATQERPINIKELCIKFKKTYKNRYYNIRIAL
jgi:hypothetical protein